MPGKPVQPLLFPLNRISTTDVAALQFALRPQPLMQPAFMRQRMRAFQGLLAPRTANSRPWNTIGVTGNVDAPLLLTPTVVHRLLPYPPTYFRVFGITKDSAGVALPYCDVHLFRTVDDVEIEQTISDNQGYYEFRFESRAANYYVVAYKGGSRTLFLSDALSDIGSFNGWTTRTLSQGRGTTAASGTGVTAGGFAQLSDVNGPLLWFTPPLKAVTIAGPITFNISAGEQFDTTNYGPQVDLIRINTDSQEQVEFNFPITGTSQSGVEFRTVESGNKWTDTPTAPVALQNGDRIYGTFGAVPVGVGHDGDTITWGWNGAVPSGQGDSYITFTETLHELAEVPVAGTTVNTLVGA